MSEQQSRKQYVSHSVLNDRYPHGRVEKVTAEGIWLEGDTVWHHFNKKAMARQILPHIGSYVVMTEDENHLITHVAMQHELQQPPEASTPEVVENYRPPVGDPRISATDEAYFEAERKREATQLHTASAQLNTALEAIGNVDSLVDYRIRTDALALAVQLLNLEAHYGIDRDDIFRVAKEVIRWIQAKGEE